MYKTTHYSTTNPTPDDDIEHGFYVGSMWWNSNTFETLVCVDAAEANAEWWNLESCREKQLIIAGQIAVLGDTPITVISAQGANLGTEIISASAFIDVGLQLEVAEQTLDLFYETVGIGSPICQLSNAIVEKAADAAGIFRLKSGDGEMGINEAIKVGFSGSGNPSAGSAAITLFIHYRILDFS